MDRREFLQRTGAGAAAGALAALSGCRGPEAPALATSDGDWSAVRAQFLLDPEYIHLAGLLLAAHPAPVREAIAAARDALDRNPALYLEEHYPEREAEVRQAAAEYLDVRPADIALTDSTTMGIAVVYNGVRIRAGQEFLTARFDYYSTHEAVRYKAARTGATVRRIELYRDLRHVTEEEIVETLLAEVRPETRVVTATWVHSSTGLKLPIRAIAERLEALNRERPPEERVLLAVDGVHGLGVEADSPVELGCDFFMAGTHKWLFGPRGTGIVWGNPRSQAEVTPTIPTFSRGEGWGPRMTPGGFHAFEHQWALAEAFRFHRRLGKTRVQQRIHALARRLKEGLAGMRHVRLYTPLDDRLSAGIVCFDIDGMRPGEVVRRLRDRKIVSSVTPYSPSYARLTPGLYNTEEEIERALRAIAELG